VHDTLYGDKPGCYPYYSENDPLLNYPIGRSGGRAPLLNMIAIAFSRLLLPFMDEVDALGYSMQFVPALFGALLVFPVYYIGRTVFGRKEGLIAAFLIPLIPVHLASGHGSAYTLFDHDSFNLLMFFLTYLFLIKSIREEDVTRSTLFALLAGVPLAGLTMTWVEAKFLYVVIFIYFVVQSIVDLYTGRFNVHTPRSVFLTLFTGYILSLPVILARVKVFPVNTMLLMVLGVVFLGSLCYLFSKKNLPWTLSIPILIIVGVAGLVFLYFIPAISSVFPSLSSLKSLWEVIYGRGIYGKKVSMTIAEANVYNISRTVMSFGPTLYWLAWAGFILIAYRFIRKPIRRDYLLLIVVFLIEMWLSAVAGRFINDLVPIIALFSGWFLSYLTVKINYKEMIKVIQSVGGGLHGLKRGVRFLHVFGILFVVLLVILPNTYLALDAATPYTKKKEIFGDLPSGAFFTSFGKEGYWVAAYTWLSQQDKDIKDPTERPAFISWWDYGFYEVALGGHPTVADNFQDGIPPAANFHTSTSEEEAVAVLIIRLLEGDASLNNGKLSPTVKETLVKHLGEINGSKLAKWVENPFYSPSYGAPIASEYTKEISQQYPVGEQWPMNAVYHDGVTLITENLDDEGVTWLYHDIQNVTGKSIRYYGVEGYDKQIFNIFSFLADKSLLLVALQGGDNPEDEFMEIKFVTQSNRELSYDELKERSTSQSMYDPVVKTKTIYKDAYFDTMFYRTYIGMALGESGGKQEPGFQMPCFNMRHFYAQYVSPYSKYPYYTGKSAVVIAKYYEGAYINGTILFNGEPQDNMLVVVRQNVTLYGGEVPIDHDSDVAENGSFHVIAPAGNITLQIRRYPELGLNAFPVTNFSFNNESNLDLSPITEEEAMRLTDNFTRMVTIEIQPAIIQGYVYDERGNDTVYNASIDQPIKDAVVSVRGVERFKNGSREVAEFDRDMIRVVKTDSNGFYNISGLLPGYYAITVVTPDGFRIEHKVIPVPEGLTVHNVSLPKPGNVSGRVYFDENENGKYDNGEEIKGATVNLVYTTTGADRVVNTTVTDESGRYAFYSVVPGDYKVEAIKEPEYEGSEEVTLEEKESKKVNVTVDYIPVTVEGATVDQETMMNIGNISIAFIPDNSVENNTARFLSVRSNETGYYTAELRPGVYNVSVTQQVNISGVPVTYKYSGHLTAGIGEGRKTFNILLVREQ
ncbi:MAG TPA: hypothetical protein ENG62_01595, partial [Thermoplasmatales archaeon]|nr:hypothetical protein [Thermoplasmatales archaeon]